MSALSYWIYSGNDPVTNATGVVLTDLDETKRLATQISEGQPDSTISVVSRVSEPFREWVSTVARFRNGAEIPWRWRVDFFGYLMDVDHVRLSEASIVYEDGRSEIGPGGTFRSGLARNVVTLEAEDGETAIAVVQAALGPTASKCSEWNVEPAWVGGPATTPLQQG